FLVNPSDTARRITAMEAMFNMVNLLPKPVVPHLPSIDLHHSPKETTSEWNADGDIQLPSPVPRPTVGSPYCTPSKIMCKLGPAGEVLFCAKHCLGRYVYSPKPCHYVMSLGKVCCPARGTKPSCLPIADPRVRFEGVSLSPRPSFLYEAMSFLRMSTRTSRQHHTDFSNYPFKAGDIAYCKDRPDVLEDDGRVSEAYPARPVILVRENLRHAHHWEVMFFTLNEKVDTQGFASSSLLPYDDGYSKFESVRLWNKPRPEHEKEYMEAVGWEVEQAAKAHKDRQALPSGMRQVLDAATVKEKSESSGARARVRTRSRSSSRRTASLDRSASPKARSRSPVYAGSSRVRGHTPPDEHPTRHSRRTHGSFKPGDLYRATITRMLPESDIYMPEAGSRALPIDSSPSNSSAVATSSKVSTEESEG
ncbi:hypothetical protein FOZ62_030145, partial [Perkinsus olseni]